MIRTILNLEVRDYKEDGYMLTQYDSHYCGVSESEFMEYVFDEIFKAEIDIDDIGDYNDFLVENNRADDYLVQTVDELLVGLSVEEAFRLGYHNADFSLNDDYFNFNGYGNIQGYSDTEVVDMMKERDFFNYCIENELIEIDEDYMKQVIEHCNELVKQGY